jgi:hypothetical protein
MAIIDESKIIDGSFGLNLSGREMAVLFAIIGSSTTNRANADLAHLGFRYITGSRGDGNDPVYDLYQKMLKILKNVGAVE